MLCNRDEVMNADNLLKQLPFKPSFKHQPQNHKAVMSHICVCKSGKFLNLVDMCLTT